jgi:hypothetical protein
MSSILDIGGIHLTNHQLFYNKRSQFVSGVEEEKVNVCVGQKVCSNHSRFEAAQS